MTPLWRVTWPAMVFISYKKEDSITEVTPTKKTSINQVLKIINNK